MDSIQEGVEYIFGCRQFLKADGSTIFLSYLSLVNCVSCPSAKDGEDSTIDSNSGVWMGVVKSEVRFNQ